MPVLARTFNSLYFASASGSRPSIVPIIAPKNPNGMLTMPGFSSGKIAFFPIKLGEIKINTSEEINPVASPATAPLVLNRRQKSDNTITGRFAEAATAKASATKKATFAVGPRMIAIAMEIPPTTKAVMRATLTSSCGLFSCPCFKTFDQKSCANEVEAEMVNPATTAKIVANAIAEIKAKNKSPAMACASNGAGKLRAVRCFASGAG